MDPAQLLNHFVTLENVGLTYRLYSSPQRTLKDTVIGFARPGRGAGSYSELSALEDIDLRIREGEVLGIVGANGAGKSSLLRVISRIYRPTAGRVLSRGFLVPLFQVGLGFHQDLSARENIRQAGSYLGFAPKHMDADIPEILRFSELTDYADVPIKYYSVGMRMRLAFTAGTAFTPDILVLDEVFTFGDAAFRERALQRMEELISRTRIVIIVSHSMEVLRRVCTRVVWLHKGRIECDGAPDEAIKAYANWWSMNLRGKA
jgi:lipopolysaccharide transport system ATP-binding protein